MGRQRQPRANKETFPSSLTLCLVVCISPQISYNRYTTNINYPQQITLNSISESNIASNHLKTALRQCAHPPTVLLFIVGEAVLRSIKI
jgi:hypothetical protein